MKLRRYKYGVKSRATPSRNRTGSGRPSTSSRVTRVAPRNLLCTIPSARPRTRVRKHSTFSSKLSRRLRGSQLARTEEHQWLSTIISLEWSERRRRQPKGAAAFEHLPPHRAGRPVHNGQVVLNRQNDVHLHAAQGGQVQRRNERPDRAKNWREYSHGGLGAGQRAEQRPAQTCRGPPPARR